MRSLILTSLMLLASCGHHIEVAAPVIPPVDLNPCGGWTGPTPTTNQMLADAAGAEKHGRLCDERKMLAAKRTLAAGPK